MKVVKRFYVWILHIRRVLRLAICCGASKKARINPSDRARAVRINNFQRRDITAFNFDVDLRWHRYSSNICHNIGAYENLPLLSTRFVYAPDRPTRYTARSFRSIALCRQFKGVTKGELVENSFQFARGINPLLPWTVGMLLRLVRISDPPKSPSTEPPRSLSHPLTVPEIK